MCIRRMFDTYDGLHSLRVGYYIFPGVAWYIHVDVEASSFTPILIHYSILWRADAFESNSAP